MKKDCFILRWPASLHVLASKHPLWNLCFLLPILFMAALGMRDLVAQKSYLALAFFLAAGALYWSFIEYAIHRWVYHSYLPLPRLRFFLDSFHAYHHSDLTDHRVLTAGPLMIYVLALQLLLPFYFLLSWPLLCAFAFGTLA